MKNLTTAGAALVMIMGCETEHWPPCEEMVDNLEELPIFVDSRCQETDIKLITKAAFKLNRMALSLICEPIVNIVGLIDMDHSIDSPPDNTIACYYDYPTWYGDDAHETEDLLGYAAYYRWVQLYFFQLLGMASNYRLALMMHELLHYVGVKEHAEDEGSVMSGGIGKLNTRYVGEDGDLFCDVYGCLN